MFASGHLFRNPLSPEDETHHSRAPDSSYTMVYHSSSLVKYTQ